MTQLIILHGQVVWKLNILPKSWNSSSKASTSSFDLRKEIGTWACSQFWAQTRFWTMRGENELRNGSSVRPLVLNTDSEATVETGTTSTSLAILDRTWYLSELAFHHPKISNFTSFLLSQFSAKYFSISLLHPTDFSTFKKRSHQELIITYGSTQPIVSPSMCVLPSHSHLVLPHLVNQHKSNNHTTYLWSSSPNQPSH